MTLWWLAALLALQPAQAGGPMAPRAGASASSVADRVEIGGSLSALFDVMPRQGRATEMRSRALVDITFRPNDRVRFHVEGLAEGLLADRGGRVASGMVAAREAWIEVAGRWGDLRAGYGRIAWGRLDEVQPSDVINPIDTARFFLDGRSEARRPVALVRGRALVSDRLTVEGVVVPAFRRGRFDELDEPTSPFNLVRDAILPAGLAVASPVVDHLEPAVRLSNLQGGARVSATLGRVDVAAAVYRGFEGFGLMSFEPTFDVLPADLPPQIAVVGRLVERYPRFTMLSGDFETVVGEWTLRGEVASFVDKKFQGVSQPGIVDGQALDVGFGADRGAGGYRVFGSVLLHRQWSRSDPAIAKTDVDLIGSIEHAFGRERYLVRAFAVVNPADAFGFIRGLFAWKLRDDLELEGSAGAFLGTGDDSIARFDNRDFAFLRVRYHF